MTKKRQNNSGFTLVELLVTLSIIALLSSLMFANYREGEKTNQLLLRANKLASDLRLAQNNSLGAVKYGTTTPAGGWGIHLDMSENSSYRFFADMNGDFIYTDGEALKQYGGQIIELDPQLKISELRTEFGDVSEASIVFLPPDPQTIISDDTVATSTEITISLENEVGDIKEVKITSFGLIEVLD